ncbi:hypothetical protein [Tomitella fengzijianii]|uniref:hypothetical protein n=1 Tax=Tomitella fengzijianii TaxID=2597660 RepID=UPI00131E4BC1|nr:hypothetical protein [Tomitella fengzijianii]
MSRLSELIAAEAEAAEKTRHMPSVGTKRRASATGEDPDPARTGRTGSPNTPHR